MALGHKKHIYLHIYAIDDIFLRIGTTIEISNGLLCQAKKQAANEGAPLRVVLKRALCLYLNNRPRNTKYELKWRTEKRFMLPGVCLDDRNALFDLIEGLD